MGNPAAIAVVGLACAGVIEGKGADAGQVLLVVIPEAGTAGLLLFCQLRRRSVG